MNELEQQVVDALRAYNGGLVVTDQDIVDAGERLRKELDASRRGRSWGLVAAAAAVLVLILGVAGALVWANRAGSPPPASPVGPPADVTDPYLDGRAPTTEDLQGLWQSRESTWTTIYGFNNGTYRFDLEGTDAAGKPVNEAFWNGTIDYQPHTGALEVVDGQIVLRSATDDCVETMAAALMDDGSLHTVVTAQTKCGITVGGHTTYLQVWPHRAPELDAVRPPGDDALRAATSDDEVLGAWFRPGDPGMLTFNPDHHYVYQADGNELSGRPEAIGTWELAGGRLVLTTNDETSGCAAGQALVVEAPRVGQTDESGPNLIGSVAWLTGTPSGSDCGAGYGADWTWQRL